MFPGLIFNVFNLICLMRKDNGTKALYLNGVYTSPLVPAQWLHFDVVK